MARLWSSGFELNSGTTNVEWTDATGTSIVTTPVRSGIYAGRASVTSNSASFAYSFSNTAVIYYRFYFRIASLPSIDLRCFQGGPGGGTAIVVKTTGALQFYDDINGVQIGSDSSVLSINTWYRIEIKIDSTTISATSVDARINGTSFASGTVDFTGNPNSNSINIGVNETGTADFYFDDVAINDNVGSFQNSWPGAGSIVHLRPNADGDNHGFSVVSGGTAGAANNFTRVNEITPDDVTTYNADVVTNTTDDYNIDNTPAVLDSLALINCIQVGVRYRAAVAVLESAIKVRYKKASGGTVSKSAEITPNSTTWVTNADASPFNYPLTLYQDPDSLPLSKVKLDTSQIGVEISTGNTNAAQVSTMWLLVDFINPERLGAESRIAATARATV